MTNVPEQKNPVEGGGFQGEKRKYPNTQMYPFLYSSFLFSLFEEAILGFHITRGKNDNPHTRLRSRKGHPRCGGSRNGAKGGGGGKRDQRSST